MKKCNRCGIFLKPTAKNLAAQRKGRSLGWGHLSGSETVVDLDDYHPHSCPTPDHRELAEALGKLAFLAEDHGEKAAQVLDEISGSLKDGNRHTITPHWCPSQKRVFTMAMDAIWGKAENPK